MFSMPYDSLMWRPTNHPPRGHTSTLCIQYGTERRKKQAATRAFLRRFYPFSQKNAFRLHLSTSAPAKTPRKWKNALVYTGCITYFRTMSRPRKEYPRFRQKNTQHEGRSGRASFSFLKRYHSGYEPFRKYNTIAWRLHGAFITNP